VTVAERTYVATRIVAGLYVQPSNDAQRWFVIASYDDGTDFGLEKGPKSATFWAWGPLARDEGERIQRLAEWDPESALSDLRAVALGHADHYKTKREAVDAALASEAAG
jgi:hypothetical protein